MATLIDVLKKEQIKELTNDNTSPVLLLNNLATNEKLYLYGYDLKTKTFKGLYVDSDGDAKIVNVSKTENSNWYNNPEKYLIIDLSDIKKKNNQDFGNYINEYIKHASKVNNKFEEGGVVEGGYEDEIVLRKSIKNLFIEIKDLSAFDIYAIEQYINKFYEVPLPIGSFYDYYYKQTYGFTDFTLFDLLVTDVENLKTINNTLVIITSILNTDYISELNPEIEVEKLSEKDIDIFERLPDAETLKEKRKKKEEEAKVEVAEIKKVEKDKKKDERKVVKIDVFDFPLINVLLVEYIGEFFSFDESEMTKENIEYVYQSIDSSLQQYMTDKEINKDIYYSFDEVEKEITELYQYSQEIKDVLNRFYANSKDDSDLNKYVAFKFIKGLRYLNLI
ncbi:MAG: hypothetical protein KatS3mg096_630 [Candidatus Parcubacteria bacterium]|nr:MAG: hypothetical protein KatS3mg096_630 [Candidatus Parcubacteria bacterium]